MALKLARYATGRHKTLSLWDSFHGANLDAIGVGGEALFRRDLGPMIPGAEHLPPLNLARRFFGDDKPFERFADYIDYVLEVQGDVSALIAEPMRWTTVEPPPPEFWPQVEELLPAHGALLIFDEIPSCLAPHRRDVRLRAFRDDSRHPRHRQGPRRRHHADGGDHAPADSIARQTRRSDTTPTRRARSLAPQALATLDVIDEEELIDRANELGGHGLERLRAIRERYPVIRDVRGLGCYFGVEIGGDDPARTRPIG